MANHKMLLLINLALTFTMVGLIWTIQIVHYPLFDQVGKINFTLYEASHISKITSLVLPIMLAELVTSVLLVLNPPEYVDRVHLLIGLGLVIIAWLVTFFLNVPQHNLLAIRFDEQVHKALIDSNWIRTALWTSRGVLILFLVSVQLK